MSALKNCKYEAVELNEIVVDKTTNGTTESQPEVVPGTNGNSGKPPQTNNAEQQPNGHQQQPNSPQQQRIEQPSVAQQKTVTNPSGGSNQQPGNQPQTRISQQPQNTAKKKPSKAQQQADGNDSKAPDQQPMTLPQQGCDRIDTALHKACQILDSARVTDLLTLGADPNALVEDLAPLDVTGEDVPLNHGSPLESFLQVVKALTDRDGKATTVRGAKYRETPLHVAVRLACEDSVSCERCSEGNGCSVCLQCLEAIHMLCEAGYDQLLQNRPENTSQTVYVKGQPKVIEKQVHTALHAAVSKKWLDAVDVLITYGADINARVLVPAYKKSGAREKFNRSETVLHLAVYLQWPEGVKSLLENGANPNAKLSMYAGEHTPLHTASLKLYMECLQLLLEHNADTNATNSLKLTPLDIVGSLSEDKPAETFLAALRALIDKGSRPTTNDDAKYNATPIHTALSLDCIEAIQDLYDVGYHTLLPNKLGNTPLHIVANSCSKVWLNELVDRYKATGLDAQNKQGETALHIAVHNLWLEGVTTLLKHGADITLKTAKNKTVLHVLPHKKNYVVMKELLNHKDSSKIINELDNNKSVPLFCAVTSRHDKCVFLLVDAQADLTMTDSDGHSKVIHSVIKSRQSKVLNGLFKRRKADMDNIKESVISKKEMENVTPLFLAVLENSSKCVEILIENDCNLRAEAIYEKKSCTALKLATMKGYDKIVTILLDKDPSLVNEADSKGMMPIHWASIYHHIKVIKTIVDHGCDLAAKCSLSDSSSEITAMDLFINRVPGAVNMLEKILDSCLTVHKEYIEFDYRILLPKVKGERRELRVLDALVQTGDQVDQGRLFTHPTVQSFLSHQWERMGKNYCKLVAFFLIFLVVPFQILVIVEFFLKKHVFDYVLTTLLTVIMIFGFILYFVHEVFYFYFKTTNSKYYGIWRFSREVSLFYILSLLWIIKIVFVTIIIVLPFIKPEATFSRECASLAVIVLWFEFMFLMSRVPTYGIYMLMFFEVTSNFFNVLLSFIFLIFAFVTAFVLEYQGLAPFSSIPEAFLKTIVMMTSELEYKELFDNINTDNVATTFTKVVFLIFLLAVAIVIMNIVLAKTILDVKKVDRLRKQAEFLSTSEQLLLSSQSILLRLRGWVYPNNTVQGKNMVINSQLRFDEANRFSNNLIQSIMEKAYIVNKKRAQRQKEEENQSISTAEVNEKNVIERLNSIATRLDDYIHLNTEKMNELSKKIDQLLHKQDNR